MTTFSADAKSPELPTDPVEEATMTLFTVEQQSSISCLYWEGGSSSYNSWSETSTVLSWVLMLLMIWETLKEEGMKTFLRPAELARKAASPSGFSRFREM